MDGIASEKEGNSNDQSAFRDRICLCVMKCSGATHWSLVHSESE